MLGGVDAIVFTGGIGEKSFYVREHALSNLEGLGIKIDIPKNDKNTTVISSGKVKVLVIPTNEELAIARDAKDILKSMGEKPKKERTDEFVAEQLSQLTEEDKATLVLLWAENPKVSVKALTKKLNDRINKKLRVQTVQKELEILGLSKATVEKRKQIIGSA